MCKGTSIPVAVKLLGPAHAETDEIADSVRMCTKIKQFQGRTVARQFALKKKKIVGEELEIVECENPRKSLRRI